MGLSGQRLGTTASPEPSSPASAQSGGLKLESRGKTAWGKAGVQGKAGARRPSEERPGRGDRPRKGPGEAAVRGKAGARRPSEEKPGQGGRPRKGRGKAAWGRERNGKIAGCGTNKFGKAKVRGAGRMEAKAYGIGTGSRKTGGRGSGLRSPETRPERPTSGLQG
jgi:hypothetical protein